MNIKQKIDQWVHDVFKNENFKEIKVDVTGASEIGDGYSGDIAFAKVNVVTCDGETKVLDLVIKYGKLAGNVRELLPVKQAYEREIYVYDKVVPELQNFETKKKLIILEQFFPKCFGSLLYDNEEVLFLENLKSQGYDLHDRYQPMDINHLKLTLEMYGKWHALSFAFQDQHPEKAKMLFENLEDIFASLLKSINNLMAGVQDNLYTILRHKNEVGLIERIKNQMPDFSSTFFELLGTTNDKSVFVHGDCWNNNFMFKYDSDRSKPEAVKFLDFQVSNFRPAVFDLAYHIYSNASEKELQHFDELLKIYHASLSKTLKDLGSDADSIFSFEDLIQEWKQFSSFGVMIVSMNLPIILASKENVRDIHDMASNISNTLEKTLSTDGDALTSRTIAFIKHYFDFLDKH